MSQASQVKSNHAKVTTISRQSHSNATTAKGQRLTNPSGNGDGDRVRDRDGARDRDRATRDRATRDRNVYVTTGLNKKNDLYHSVARYSHSSIQVPGERTKTTNTPTLHSDLT